MYEGMVWQQDPKAAGYIVSAVKTQREDSRSASSPSHPPKSITRWKPRKYSNTWDRRDVSHSTAAVQPRERPTCEHVSLHSTQPQSSTLPPSFHLHCSPLPYAMRSRPKGSTDSSGLAWLSLLLPWWKWLFLTLNGKIPKPSINFNLNSSLFPLLPFPNCPSFSSCLLFTIVLIFF